MTQDCDKRISHQDIILNTIAWRVSSVVSMSDYHLRQPHFFHEALIGIM